MKIVLIICAFATIASADPVVIQVTPQIISSAQPIVNKCAAETNVPPKAFQKLLTGIIEDDASLKFGYCYLVEKGFMTKEARFVPSSFYPYIKDEKDKELIKNALEECNKIEEKDHMELLRLVAACFKEKQPIVFTLSK